MFLFIFESIGTSELILIGVVALIIFGPRKLPQMARTIGKTMAEFKNATNEFKETWEKEANFEADEKFSTSHEVISPVSRENSISVLDSPPTSENSLPAPAVRELSESDIAEKFQGKLNQAKESNSSAEKTIAGKQNWL